MLRSAPATVDAVKVPTLMMFLPTMVGLMTIDDMTMIARIKWVVK